MPLPTRLDYPLLAIGDLHGQTAFLDRLLANLRKLSEWQESRVVFLGDYVDRGADVKGCVERVLEVLAEKPGSTAVLGNHDLGMMHATGIAGPSASGPGTRSPNDLGMMHATGIAGPPLAYWVERWKVYTDHRTTFRSYLGRLPRYDSPRWEEDLRELREAIPQHHREFFAGLPWVVETDGHVFMHNGLSPELDEPAEVQLELMRQRKWHGYVTPKFGTVTAAEYKPEYPVWLGADRNLSANPLPLKDRVLVTGHVRIEAPDANAVRIRLDTSGGIREPLTACLLRSATADPMFIRSDG